MKSLFFYATAPDPRVAEALMLQTANTLRPFHRFVDQAMHSARQRQFRYQLPWQPVVSQRQVLLKPVDRRVWVPRREPGWRIPDWPRDREPDTAQPLMIVSRGLTARVLECHRDPAGGLRLRVDRELVDDDKVYWCAEPWMIVRETAAPPAVLEGVDGVVHRLLCDPELDDEGWILTLDGRRGDLDLVVDGSLVRARDVPPFEGLRRLRDSAGRSFEYGGGTLEVDELPAEGPLDGDNGVRFDWRPARSGGRSGPWLQLLPPENEEAEAYLDPRAAFCEGDVQEVWTRERRSRDTVFSVKRVDSERYQLLLDRLPPEGTSLVLPFDIRNLRLQKRALRQLAEAPLPHHQGLLRLCENPEYVRWPRVPASVPERWTTLTDETRSGTDEQRSFVGQALGSPDIALLEGPPGSGKTTAICELVQQLVARGQTVLLCSSTHVAIDNVLERLIEANAPVDAVRIGHVDRVDEKVQEVQIDQKVDRLVRTWEADGRLRSLGDRELREMAVRVVVGAANLTCGTTMGIINHPLFDDLRQDRRSWAITAMPHWDVLIVDEASKALIQEFLVPGLMAKRWVIVGDVHQLPPFADRADIVANLRSLVDERGRSVFPADHQRARLLLFRLARPALRGTRARWLVVEPPGVLDRLVRELRQGPAFPLSVSRVVARAAPSSGPVTEVSVADVRAGSAASLALVATDWVLVSEDLLPGVADQLPADLLHHRELSAGKPALPESHALLFRHAWWLAQAGRLPRPYRERRQEVATFAECEALEQRWLAQHDLASEIAWRLTRIHELKHSRDRRDRERLTRELDHLLPVAADIADPVAEIQDIGLPSILEVLQEGIGVARSERPSALTEGMPLRRAPEFQARFGSLSYQHRMHPEISAFPRDVIYRGRALLDANTIAIRDRDVGWSFGNFRRRVAWVDVHGREQGGVNQEEVRVAEAIVRRFLAWAREVGPPRDGSRPRWEVACLAFYLKQARALSAMVSQVSGDPNAHKSRFTAECVEFVCGTVDRFQGREADLVLLSMRNTGRVGFLDSPNRLNVAVTRARQQLVVVGSSTYFARCGIAELEELAKRSPCEDAGPWVQGAS